MSTELILYGCIQGIPDDDGTLLKRNREQIESLPLLWEDATGGQSGAVITRSFFALPTEDNTFFTQVIYFGGSYRCGYDEDWANWLTEFERILIGMYWFGVTLHVTGEVPEAVYEWHIDSEMHMRMLEGEEPEMEWTFSGGSRTSLWDNKMPTQEK